MQKYAKTRKRVEAAMMTLHLREAVAMMTADRQEELTEVRKRH